MTPIPPACAMAIAMRDSVTVSIAEATIGMFSRISRVMRERISTSDGSTSERPGLQQHIVEGKRLRGSAIRLARHANSPIQQDERSPRPA